MRGYFCSRLSQGLEPATALLLCPVGSQRSTLGHNRDSGKCVLVRHSLSRPCFTRERECEFLCFSIAVLQCGFLCVWCLLLVLQTGTKWHQTLRHRAATHHNYMCVIPTTLSLSVSSFALFSPTDGLVFSLFCMHMFLVSLSLHFVFCVNSNLFNRAAKYLQCQYNYFNS